MNGELYTLLQASAHELPMINEKSVHAIITSPPFYGLRAYDGDQDVEWPAVTYRPLADLDATVSIPGCEGGCEHEWVDGRLLPVGNAPSVKGGLRVEGQRPKEGEKYQASQVQQTTRGAYCRICHGWRGPLGLEPTPAEYIGHLLLCLREWKRVLRDDGLVFCNLGDSYAGSWGNYGARNGNQRSRIAERWHRPGYEDPREGWTGLPPTAAPPGIPAKNLLLIPYRFALAAQADGWIVRSDIVWAKGLSFCPTYAGSVMPESVRDRPTKAHEYIFLLSKQEHYFWDDEAVKETAVKGAAGSTFTDGKTGINGNGRVSKLPRNEDTSTRHIRTVWAISPRGYSGAHFAVWPEALVEPMVLASASARGVCPQCGAQWARVVERSSVRPIDYNGKNATQNLQHSARRMLANVRARREAGEDHNNPFPGATTTGWAPSCRCYGTPLLPEYPKPPEATKDAAAMAEWENACGPIRQARQALLEAWLELPADPATVCDPFCGSGTTGAVATKHGRRFIGVDLSAEYLDKLSPERLELQPYLTGSDMGAL